MCKLYNIKKIPFHFVLIIVFVSLLSNVVSQRNRTGLVRSYSSSARDYSDIFHVIRLSTAFDAQTMPFFGLGYGVMKLGKRDSRFIQAGISYSIGYHLKQAIPSHNIVLSVHSNYISRLDLNPFTYGLSLHYMAVTDKDEVYDNLRTNEYPGNLMSNFYIRPEIGFSLPLRHDKKVTSCLITYGYNIQSFWDRNEIKKYKEDIANNENIDKTLMPYTSKSHHMIILRVNFRVVSKKARAYF